MKILLPCLLCACDVLDRAINVQGAVADPAMGEPGGPPITKIGAGHDCVKQSASDTGRAITWSNEC